jgi:hypothetical protein
MKRKPKPTVTVTKPPGQNPHDRFARKTMSDPLIAADLLRHYTDPVIAKCVDLDGLKPEPTQKFGKEFQELFKDVAFASHLIDKKGKAEVLIIAEHKSKPEPFVLLQLLVYLTLSWYKRWNDAGRPQSTKKFRLPLPVLVVLYNGREKWDDEPDIKSLVSPVPPELEPFVPQVRVLFIRLNQFDKQNLPGKPETRAVVESMIRATEGTFVAGLENIFGHFRGSSLDDRILELLEDIVRYCNWVEQVTPDEVDKVISNIIERQEKNKMSQAVKAVRKTFERIARESYVAEAKAGSIIRFLDRRFQKVPKTVRDKVSAITDINRLDELTDQAAECQSLAEFSKSLQSQ